MSTAFIIATVCGFLLIVVLTIVAARLAVRECQSGSTPPAGTRDHTPTSTPEPGDHRMSCTLVWGMGAPSILQQLKAQLKGLQLSSHQYTALQVLQNDADALTRLSVNRVLDAHAMAAAQGVLHARVEQVISSGRTA